MAYSFATNALTLWWVCALVAPCSGTCSGFEVALCDNERSPIDSYDWLRCRIADAHPSSIEMALPMLPVREVAAAAATAETVCASGIEEGRLVSRDWS